MIKLEFNYDLGLWVGYLQVEKVRTYYSHPDKDKLLNFLKFIKVNNAKKSLV